MKNLSERIKGRVKVNEKLSRHTSFRIGGAIDVWAEPEDLNDLKEILRFGEKHKKPIYIIGGGSNLLVNDEKISGIAVYLAAPFFKNIEVRKNRIIAGAGVSLKKLLSACSKKGLAGLEFCSGIPGTLGGAVVMNAGSGARNSNSNIGNFVDNLRIMDRTGKVVTIKKRHLDFGYRSSSVNGFVVLEAELALRRMRKDYIKKLCSRALEGKQDAHELDKSSAGCVFKNPYNGLISAGKLIDLAGLKAKRVGDAKVSEKNANYIINLGNARFKDVKKLIAVIKNRIKKEFNTELELEVKVWE